MDRHRDETRGAARSRFTSTCKDTVALLCPCEGSHNFSKVTDFELGGQDSEFGLTILVNFCGFRSRVINPSYSNNPT